jgi:hypothetical protein
MLYGADVGGPGTDVPGHRQIRERFGGINGVFHTAGVTGGGMIQLKTPESAARSI